MVRSGPRHRREAAPRPEWSCRSGWTGNRIRCPGCCAHGVDLGTAIGRQRIRQAPLWALVGVHGVRLLGFSFLLLWAAHRLPAPFAPSAGWGDIVAGLLAVPLALNLRSAGRPRSQLWIQLWNTLGVAYLLTALFLGATSSPGPLQLFHVNPSSAIMTTLPWILVPAFLVPSLLFLHICVYYRMAILKSADQTQGLTAAATAS